LKYKGHSFSLFQSVVLNYTSNEDEQKPKDS